MLYTALKFLHVLFMASWLVAGVTAGPDAKKAVHMPDPDPARRARADRAKGIFGTVTGMGAIVTGVALLFSLGGFGAVRWPIHAGLLLSVVMAFIGALGIGGNAHKLAAAIDADAPLIEREALAKKVSMWAHIKKTLWVVVLALMVFRNVL